MREILFRIENHGEWYYGFPISEVKHSKEVGNYVSFMGNAVKDGSSYYDLFADATTLGQFTGLLDKNSKKIFEGDILKARCNDRPYIVSFNSGRFEIQDKYGCVIKTTQEAVNWLEVEIIGNIYDNPELSEVVNND